MGKINRLQEKSGKLEETPALLRLKINSSKTKGMRNNSKNNTPIIMDQNPLEDVNSLTYLGSIISMEGATEDDVQARVRTARTTFNMFNNIWEAKNLVTQDQTANLQLKSKDHSTPWLRILENYHHHTQ